MDDGSSYRFNSCWNVWVHEISSNNWELESYKKIFTISNMQTFWFFFNNFEKLDYRRYDFYIMKNNIKPRWEDTANINGGVCSMRLPCTNFIDLWIIICIYIIAEKVVSYNNDITGIIFNLRNCWTLFKIWNADYDNNINENMNDKLKNLFSEYSIQYKKINQ